MALNSGVVSSAPCVLSFSPCPPVLGPKEVDENGMGVRTRLSAPHLLPDDIHPREGLLGEISRRCLIVRQQPRKPIQLLGLGPVEALKLQIPLCALHCSFDYELIEKEAP